MHLAEQPLHMHARPSHLTPLTCLSRKLLGRSMHALPTQRIPSLTSHSPSPLSHLSLEEAVGQVHAPLHQRTAAAVDGRGKGTLPGLVAGGGDVGGVIHARHTLLVEAHT